MRLFTFGELRATQLPPEQADECDAMRALRMNCNSKFPDRAKVAVPPSVEKLITELRKPLVEADDEPAAED